MKKISNLPYKGCNDYYGVEMLKHSYILSKFRSCCEKFGYKEYLTPVLESAEIYEAKSGEDIGKELFRLQDSGGRSLCLRPEMTPSVTRLVTRFYTQVTKPVRLFSIANFLRGERPQKGRGREFWQLNADIFGEESLYADIEIFALAIEIMKAFNAPQNSFILRFNNRKLIDSFFSKILKLDDKDLKQNLVRKMDKYNKMTVEEFQTTLKEINFDQKQIDLICEWMKCEPSQLLTKFPDLLDEEGLKEVNFTQSKLERLGYGASIQYSPDLIRGFDYYDGNVFEIFDLSGNFSRSIFGGGRYNGLADLFTYQKIPAVGFAPGETSLTIFLDNWNLWPDFAQNQETYYLPLLEETLYDEVYALASKLRLEGKNVEMGIAVSKLQNEISYASKNEFNYLVIFGTEESKNKTYIVKNLITRDQEEYKL